ncbi:MAG: phospholipase D-like domain-containing protein [Candidatus Bipolaricaulaceae bacterium]
MRVFATVFSLIFQFLWAWSFTVLPLWSTPENPAYLSYVPGLLSSAKEEILLALSDLRSYADGTTDPLLSALCRAAEQGVAVYVLVEKRDRPFYPEQEEALARLRAAGVKIREDPQEITLHAKFIVVDAHITIVGSTHWTKTALTSSVQMDLVLEDSELTSLFRRFFFLLWEGKLRTKTELPSQPWPSPALIPLLDFPESKTNFTAIYNLIGQAQHNIFLLLYELVLYPAYSDSPSNLLLQALAAAAKRGVRVQVLLEGGENDPNLAEANRLSAAWLKTFGVEVRFESTSTIMHAKCLVADGSSLAVSSANWNYSSLVKNVEAGVLILGAPELARFLEIYFSQLWEKCTPSR